MIKGVDLTQLGTSQNLHLWIMVLRVIYLHKEEQNLEADPFLKTWNLRYTKITEKVLFNYQLLSTSKVLTLVTGSPNFVMSGM